MRCDTSAKVGALLLDGFPSAALTSLIEPLKAANDVAGQAHFEWVFLSETGGSVESTARMRVQADAALSFDSSLTHLFLLGPTDGGFDNPKHSASMLRRINRNGTILGAISGGIFPLAATGLLDGYACATHWIFSTAFAAAFPQVQISDKIVVRDRMRLTAAGAAGAFDLSIQLVEEAAGRSVATEVACWFQHPIIRDAGIRQQRPALTGATTMNALPGLIRRAAQLFGERIEDPIAISEVAKALNVSPRHLERLFKVATGGPPSKYYRLIRLQAGRQLVVLTDKSFAEIARQTGYSNSSRWRRDYAAAFHRTPKDDRDRRDPLRQSGHDVGHPMAR